MPKLQETLQHSGVAINHRWSNARLSEICSIIYGYTDSATTEPVGPRFLRITDIQDDRVNWSTVPYCSIDRDKISRYTLLSGDIVFSRTGATTGKSFLVLDPPEAVFASYLIRLRLLEKNALPKFVNYYFQTSTYWRVIAEGSVGSAQGGFNASKLGNLAIPLPSKREQERIIAILDETFEGIAKTRANANRVLTVSIALFESRVAQVFSARGDGWKQQRLDDVCSDITVGHVGSMIKEYRDDGVPFLRSQNIRPFRISLENVVYIDAAFNATLKKSQLRPGDLAIVRTGYPGTAAVIPSDLPISNCSDLVIVRPGPALDPFYMAHFFNSAHGKRLVLGNLVGSAQKHFNIGSAKSVSVPVPSLKQQQQVVSMLDEFRAEVQRLEAVHLQKLESLEALKQSILQQAFSGTL
ncbi:restriction endonuclease subunit S [Granulicella sp. dw_53]|uniref:restriction endonuclease subunit S n=1 Tax=Granulicella sp. dw_53 TaxID=2719792 RepID=UPI001BD289DA|nr:restriction endonuclease subunit S [Granulicella sp. dw_53]